MTTKTQQQSEIGHTGRNAARQARHIEAQYGAPDADSDLAPLVPAPTMGLSGTRLEMANIHNQYGRYLAQKAGEIGVNVESAAAVLRVESGGRAYSEVGGRQRPIIRFENHVFFGYFTNGGKDQTKVGIFKQHFQFDADKRWLGHRFRASDTDQWKSCHQNQSEEYEVFEFAKTLDSAAALKSMSMGLGQIMGFNAHEAGYESAQAMFDAFSDARRGQLDGFFAFVQHHNRGRCLKALQGGDYAGFALNYNGSGQVSKYSALISQAADAYGGLTSRIADDPARAPHPSHASRTRPGMPLVRPGRIGAHNAAPLAPTQAWTPRPAPPATPHAAPPEHGADFTQDVLGPALHKASGIFSGVSAGLGLASLALTPTVVATPLGVALGGAALMFGAAAAAAHAGYALTRAAGAADGSVPPQRVYEEARGAAVDVLFSGVGAGIKSAKWIAEAGTLADVKMLKAAGGALLNPLRLVNLFNRAALAINQTLQRFQRLQGLRLDYIVRNPALAARLKWVGRALAAAKAVRFMARLGLDGITNMAHRAMRFGTDLLTSAGAKAHQIRAWMAERHYDTRRMAMDLAHMGLHGLHALTRAQLFKGLTELPGRLLHHVLAGAARAGDMAAHSKLARWLAEKRDATFAKVGAGVAAGRRWLTDTAPALPGSLLGMGGRLAHGAFDKGGEIAHRMFGRGMNAAHNVFDLGGNIAHNVFGLGGTLAHRIFDNDCRFAHKVFDKGGTLTHWAFDTGGRGARRIFDTGGAAAHTAFDAATGVAQRLGLDTTLANKVFNTGSAIANSIFKAGTGMANRAFNNTGDKANRVFDTAGSVANKAFGFGGMIAGKAFSTGAGIANSVFNNGAGIANNVFNRGSAIANRVFDNLSHPDRMARRAFDNAGNKAHKAFDAAGTMAHKVFDAGTGVAQRLGFDTTLASRVFNTGGAVANRVFDTGGAVANKAFNTGMGMAGRVASLPGAVMRRVSHLGGLLPTFGPGLLPQPAFGLPGGFGMPGFGMPGSGLSLPSPRGVAQAAAPLLQTAGSLAGGAIGGVTRAAGSAASSVGSFLGNTLGIQFSGGGGHPDTDPGALLHGLKQQSSGFTPDSSIRATLGGHLGFDPAQARLHTGPAAAHAARDLNAEAFTIGKDVFFGEGRFDPASSKGLGLIAHELTHVGQQTGTTGDRTRFFTGRGGDEMEQEAQQVGERVLANAGRSQGVSVGLYDRRYEGDGEDGLAESDRQRLDVISLMALKEAENLLWRRGVKGRRSLEALDVSVDLDLSRMSDPEAARVWAEAIVDAVGASSGLAAPQHATAAPARIQRYEGGEHKWLGDHGYEAAIEKRLRGVPPEKRAALRAELERRYGKTMRRGSDGKALTYGSGIALGGDFYGTPGEMYNDREGWYHNTDVDDLNDVFRQEIKGAEAGKVGEHDYQSDENRSWWNSANEIDLAKVNTPHFVGHNMKAYMEYHRKAIELAMQAHNANDEAERGKLWDQARFTNAFADHFLTDSFSSGHMRVPREEIMTFFRQRGIKDERSGLMAKILHDYDNENGVLVLNARGDHWTAYGDTLLFADKDPARRQSYQVTGPGVGAGAGLPGGGRTGRDLALEAVEDSVDELMTAYDSGAAPKSYGALPLIPFPDPKQSDKPDDLFKVFNARMSPQDRKKFYDALGFKKTLAGSSPADMDLLVDNLGQMMADFHQHMREQTGQDADMASLPDGLRHSLAGEALTTENGVIKRKSGGAQSDERVRGKRAGAGKDAGTGAGKGASETDVAARPHGGSPLGHQGGLMYYKSGLPANAMPDPHKTYSVTVEVQLERRHWQAHGLTYVVTRRVPFNKDWAILHIEKVGTQDISPLGSPEKIWTPAGDTLHANVPLTARGRGAVQRQALPGLPGDGGAHEQAAKAIQEAVASRQPMSRSLLSSSALQPTAARELLVQRSPAKISGQDVGRMSLQDKLMEAVKRALPKMPASLAAQLQEQLPYFVGGIIVFVGLQFVPGVDAAVDIAGYLMYGAMFLQIAKQIYSFYRAVDGAKSDADLDRAADMFAAMCSDALLNMVFAAAAKKIKLPKGKGKPGREIPEENLDPHNVAQHEKYKAELRAQEEAGKVTKKPPPRQSLKVPEGLTEAEFSNMSATVREGAGHYGNDIRVHGSRAAGTARPDSDVDIAIRVTTDKFEHILRERFGKPAPGSAKERTMLHARETGKIQAGEAGLRGLRQSAAKAAGKKVDISVIRSGGPFDKGPWIPLK